MHMLTTLIILLMLTFPALAQEETPEPLELSKVYRTEEAWVTFAYPEGWFTQAESEFTVQVANREDALGLFIDDAHEAGVIALEVSTFPTLDFRRQIGLKVEPDAQASDILEILMAAAVRLSAVEFGEPASITLNDHEGMMVDISRPTLFDGRLWVIELQPQLFAIARLTTAPGEFADAIATAEAILATIDYEYTPELTESITTQNGLMTFNYPAGWLNGYESSDENTAIIANSQQALGRTLGDQVSENDVNVLVGAYFTADIAEQLGIEGEVTPLEFVEAVLASLTFEDRAEWTFSEPELTTINGLDAAYATVSGATFVDQIWFFELQPGVLVGVTLISHPDTAAKWAPIAEAVAATITFEEP